jgi:hypothetical protein
MSASTNNFKFLPLSPITRPAALVTEPVPEIAPEVQDGTSVIVPTTAKARRSSSMSTTTSTSSSSAPNAPLQSGFLKLGLDPNPAAVMK